MHGRKKSDEQNKSLEEREAMKKKIQAYSGVAATLMKKRVAKEYTPEAKALTGKLLGVNPDFSTLWNYRREIFQSNFEAVESDEERKQLCEGELALTEEGIKKNPKSYCAWFHRRWTVEKGFSALEKELALCDLFLKMDERNFHCWNYRRFVVQRSASRDPVAELDFTSKKIHENFSNYSAYHQRSKILPTLNSGSGPSMDALSAEFELVQNAVFTEHDDQSAWLYHRWLVGYYRQILTTTCGEEQGNKSATAVQEEVEAGMCDVLYDETTWVRQLLDTEPDSKWGNATLSHLLLLLTQSTAALGDIATEKERGGGQGEQQGEGEEEYEPRSAADLAAEAGEYAQESQKLLERLATELDPQHANYYRAQIEVVAAAASVQ